VLLLAGSLLARCQATETPTAYYVDCGAIANDTIADGTSPEHPLQTLAAVNSRTYHAGEKILFKRGSTCEGTFAPKGSGRKEAPIRVGTYGEGAKPRIRAGNGSEAAVVLFNQEYWEIASLDISGSTRYGAHVGGDRGTLHHIHLLQLSIHDVLDPHSEMKKKASGLVVVEASSPDAAFDDVLVDGVIAERTNQWSGIFISGSDGKAITTHVSVKNSMVHDVQGDGIVLFRMRDGIIANSVAWRTGLQDKETIGTPNAIWTWSCEKCTVENNEAFLTDSSGIDGGAFDIDYWNTGNIVRNNYGHDTQGYCVSVFAAFRVTKASEISGNLCIRNGLSPRLAAKQGAIFILTWQYGALDGVAIKNNTVYWDPSGAFPAIQTGDGVAIRNLSVERNTIYSSAPAFVSPRLQFDGSTNCYFYMERNKPAEDLRAEQKSTPESRAIGRGGIACWSGCNYAGKRNLSPAESEWISQLRDAANHPVQRPSDNWMLYAELPSDADSQEREIVLLKSQSSQFRAAGLRVVAVTRGTRAEMRQLSEDWRLDADGIAIATEEKESPTPSMLLISPGAEVLQEWHELPSIQSVGLSLRQIIGEPIFADLPAQ